MLPAEEASPPEVFLGLLEERCPRFGMTLDCRALEKMARFLAELDHARRQTNLTGPLTVAELVDHALESALGERLIPHGAEVIDIGSGAGFPGVPLAIVRSDICVTPVEPRRKRIEFLKDVSEKADLQNVFAYATSLSEVVEGFAGVATARAVGQIDRILGTAPFLKKGGLFLAWTTDAPDLARRLGPRFSLEARLAVPESRRKVIAAFRKRQGDVPRGTSGARRRRATGIDPS